jgi:hypothetical protein
MKLPKKRSIKFFRPLEDSVLKMEPNPVELVNVKAFSTTLDFYGTTMIFLKGLKR